MFVQNKCKIGRKLQSETFKTKTINYQLKYSLHIIYNIVNSMFIYPNNGKSFHPTFLDVGNIVIHTK